MTQALDNRTLRELYKRQLESGFARLKFHPAIEPDFARSHAEGRIRFTRIGLLLAAAFYSTYLLIKLVVDSEPLFATTFLRTAIILSTLLSAWCVGRLRHQWLQPLIMSNYLFFTSCLLAIEVISLMQGEIRHYEGMIFVIIHCALFSGLLFRRCMFTIVGMLLIYSILGALFDLPTNELAYQVFFLLLAAIMSCVSVYLAEHAERDSFLHRRVMAATANFDELTGLASRAAFDRYLKSHLRRSAADPQTQQALILLDLDYFKQLNDSRGHDTGDKCLKLVADILKQAINGPEQAAGRWGGDELIAVTPVPDEAILAQQLETIRRNVEALQLSNPASPLGHLSVSLGALIIPAQQRLQENLLFTQADAALYDAKAQGRNQVVIRQVEMDAKADPAPSLA